MFYVEYKIYNKKNVPRETLKQFISVDRVKQKQNFY